jgi:hypothetical protein
MRANKKDDLSAAWPARVQNSRSGARRTRPHGVNKRDAHKDRRELPRQPLASLAVRRLPAQQLQRKHGSVNKKGRGPAHNLAEGRRAVNNVGRENRRAERKKVKRLLRVLDPNNAS